MRALNKQSSVQPLGMLGKLWGIFLAFLRHCRRLSAEGIGFQTRSPRTHRPIVPFINYINYYSNPHCSSDPRYQPQHRRGGIWRRVTRGLVSSEISADNKGTRRASVPELSLARRQPHLNPLQLSLKLFSLSLHAPAEFHSYQCK